jgi:hypothetical protein
VNNCSSLFFNQNMTTEFETVVDLEEVMTKTLNFSLSVCLQVNRIILETT